MKIPYICHVRFLPGGFPSWLFRFWVNRQLASANRVVAVSDFLKSQLPADQKIIRIYDRMMPSPDDRVIPNRTGHWILYLSNIIPGKGHDLAILAFEEARREDPGWRLRIVGSDMDLEKNRRYRKQLDEMASRRGVEEAIEWKDFVDDTAAEYLSADIFTNFSSSESFSMTCLEAQYYGCCVVATNSGGPAEIIVDGKSGILVPVGDVNAMEKALTKLMADPSLRKSMGDFGAQHVRKKFAPSNTSEVLRSVYSEILPGRESH
jgi:glycosyltransferase involved in cell wall biosynthesis